jgi:hypothetical protein
MQSLLLQTSINKQAKKQQAKKQKRSNAFGISSTPCEISSTARMHCVKLPFFAFQPAHQIANVYITRPACRTYIWRTGILCLLLHYFKTDSSSIHVSYYVIYTLMLCYAEYARHFTLPFIYSYRM